MIPTADVSTLVVEGAGEAELSRAVGRIPGTAGFGERGTVGVAGHRDSQFRNLGRLRVGDRLTVTTPEANYVYEVESTLTVPPDSVEILQSPGYPRLALVTCFPFRYIGPAPRRFVVLARQVISDTRRPEAGRPSPL